MACGPARRWASCPPCAHRPSACASRAAVPTIASRSSGVSRSCARRPSEWSSRSLPSSTKMSTSSASGRPCRGLDPDLRRMSPQTAKPPAPPALRALAAAAASAARRSASRRSASARAAAMRSASRRSASARAAAMRSASRRSASGALRRPPLGLQAGSSAAATFDFGLFGGRARLPRRFFQRAAASVQTFRVRLLAAAASCCNVQLRPVSAATRSASGVPLLLPPPACSRRSQAFGFILLGGHSFRPVRQRCARLPAATRSASGFFGRGLLAASACQAFGLGLFGGARARRPDAPLLLPPQPARRNAFASACSAYARSASGVAVPAAAAQRFLPSVRLRPVRRPLGLQARRFGGLVGCIGRVHHEREACLR